MPIAAAAMVALVVAVGVPVWAEDAGPPTQQEVEEALTCQCGCGLTVHSCNHLNCGSGEPMKKEIAQRIAKGENKEQILSAFSQRFGEKVLSSPTFRGFNWFAWLTPFAVVLLSGAVLAVAIRRRVQGGAAAPAAAPAAVDPALRDRLSRELDRLDRE